MASSYKAISLFAGIGGICKGFKQAGVDIVWANEIDKDACITYRYNFGDTYLCEGDIKNINPNSIPDFTILTAGFPCQSFSVAGYRKGFEDERGNLFLEIIRIAKAKKPRVIFLENVKNIISHNKGNTFRVILEMLESEGYLVKYKIMNTSEYGNLPQNRERIYIVAFQIEEDYDNFEFPQAVLLTKQIKDIVNLGEKKDDYFYYNRTKYYNLLKEVMIESDSIYQWRRVYVRKNKSNVCPTLTANMGTGGHNVPLIKDNFDIRKLTPVECVKFQGFPDDFTFPEGISKAACYKQAGNSVSVPVIYRISINIIKSLKKTDIQNKSQANHFLSGAEMLCSVANNII